MEWYFVCPVNQGLEVQILDADGRSRDSVFFQNGERKVMLKNHSVPIPVLEAAEKTTQVGGQYVDREGRTLDFLGQPLSTETS